MGGDGMAQRGVVGVGVGGGAEEPRPAEFILFGVAPSTPA